MLLLVDAGCMEDVIWGGWSEDVRGVYWQKSFL